MNRILKSVSAMAMAVLCFSFAAHAQKGKWVSLFDGKTIDQWHIYNKTGLDPKWQVEDGAIVLTAGGAGDLVTNKEYGDFELELEWKISEGGNSGIMYHCIEDAKYNAPYYTGPEMQVLDNERHPDGKKGKDGNRTSTSLYDMIAPSDPSAYKPAMEWNKVKLVIKDGKATHYMNGKKVVEYPTSGPVWDKMVSESKFAEWEAFGKSATGKIALQDHGDKVWFRNIRIKEL